jgi:hypothetical protein
MTFARIEDNPDSNAAALGLVERVENDGIREGVGREVNRAFGGGDKGRVASVAVTAQPVISSTAPRRGRFVHASSSFQLTWLVRFDFSVFVSVGRYFAAGKSEWRIGQHPIDPVHIFTFLYPGPEPNCLTRPVSEHDQPHIRSPLETAAPTSRLRRAGAQANETILPIGVLGPWTTSVRTPGSARTDQALEDLRIC